jgi:hypothetical protein
MLSILAQAKARAHTPQALQALQEWLGRDARHGFVCCIGLSFALEFFMRACYSSVGCVHIHKRCKSVGRVHTHKYCTHTQAMCAVRQGGCHRERAYLYLKKTRVLWAGAAVSCFTLKP